MFQTEPPWDAEMAYFAGFHIGSKFEDEKGWVQFLNGGSGDKFS
jgi:hypothetical protein